MTDTLRINTPAPPVTLPQRLEFQDTLAKKVGRAAATALFYIARVVLAPLTFAAVSYRLYSEHSMKDTIEELAKKRYEALDGFYPLTPPPKGGYHRYMQTVRSEIDAALAKGKENPELLHAAHILTVWAPGMDEIEAYGKKITDQISEKKNLADILDEAVKRHTYFNKDSVISHIFWAFAHPEKALAAFFDQIGLEDPMKYNSYKNGNANTYIGSFDVNGTKVHFSLGPTPTCDCLFEAHLKYLQQQGMKHIFQDVEGETAAERTRVKAKRKMAKKYPNQLMHVNTPFDPETIQSVIAQIEGKEAYFTQACKQDIDRGVVLNVITLLQFDKLAGKDLTQERINQIVGIVLLRAGMVDDRAILANRYKVLSDYLRRM